ncbi:MAG: DUF427 domain-containing protein [Nocardioides sp.]
MARVKPDPVQPGQESVWDYPRPPRVEPSSETIEVHLGGEVLARSTASYRVLETSHPPTYYLPTSAFASGVLRPVEGTTFCEWKGHASYYDLAAASRTAPRAGWAYPTPSPGFEMLVDHVAVMPASVDACFVDGERVVAQPGGFYGGWITSRVAGPFKGAPGSWGW